MKQISVLGVILMLAMRPSCWPVWACLMIVFIGMYIAADEKKGPARSDTPDKPKR